MQELNLARDALAARTGGRHELAQALRASRADTLATFGAYEKALPGLLVELGPTLNPPLWELGHIGWFQEYWIARNPERARGTAAHPESPRGAPLRAGADSLYDSSRVPHDARWLIPLPDADATRADLKAQLAQTLTLLHDSSEDDASLYFHRLVLLHEDMHHEAALYMAQALDLTIHDERWQPAVLAPPRRLLLDADLWTLGSQAGSGFAFDNELCSHRVRAEAIEIDAEPLRWAEYLPFVEAGAYGNDRYWSEAGRNWRDAQAAVTPRYLRRADGVWEVRRWGRWQPLRLEEAACHLTIHEAQAWCCWAGRRLPTEAEWERAAMTHSEFRWGQVWEWTASPFAPYPGFASHPYRDYSTPWFDGRPVLRGASFMTQPRMHHPRYRNYFPGHRSDVPAGFRSCAR